MSYEDELIDKVCPICKKEFRGTDPKKWTSSMTCQKCRNELRDGLRTGNICCPIYFYDGTNHTGDCEA